LCTDFGGCDEKKRTAAERNAAAIVAAFGRLDYGIMVSIVKAQLLRHSQLYSGKKKGSLIEPFSSD
jgi:hypothetical protein